MSAQGVRQEIFHFLETALWFSLSIFRDVLISPQLPPPRPCWRRVPNPLQTVGSYLNEFTFRDKAKGIQMPTLISTDTPRTCYTPLSIPSEAAQGQDALWVPGPGADISDQPLSRPLAFPWVLFRLSFLRSCRF